MKYAKSNLSDRKDKIREILSLIMNAPGDLLDKLIEELQGGNPPPTGMVGVGGPETLALASAEREVAARKAAKIAARATYRTLMLGPTDATLMQAANVAKKHAGDIGLDSDIDEHMREMKIDGIKVMCQQLSDEHLQQVYDLCKKLSGRSSGNLQAPAPMMMRF